MGYLFGCKHYSLRILQGIDNLGREGNYIQILKGSVDEISKKNPENPSYRKQLNMMVVHSVPLDKTDIDNLLDVLLYMKSANVKFRMRVTLFTQEEHDNFVHKCGKTGKEIEGNPQNCEKCNFFKECLASHSILEENDNVDKSGLE